MHATADTGDVIIGKDAGQRVMRGVRPLKSSELIAPEQC
jgi:hypothetical protein